MRGERRGEGSNDRGYREGRGEKGGEEETKRSGLSGRRRREKGRGRKGREEKERRERDRGDREIEQELEIEIV